MSANPSITNAERVSNFLSNKQLTDAIAIRLESGTDADEPSEAAMLQRFKAQINRTYGPLTENEHKESD